MGRLNMEPILAFPDGSCLVISTVRSNAGEFSCALYSAHVERDNRAAFHPISNHVFLGPTCLSAQEHAYGYASRFYPQAAGSIKKPPYLIWPGPQSAGIQ